MKIVLIQPQSVAAGAQRVSEVLAAEFRHRGHDVRVVCFYRYSGAYDDDPGVDILLDHRPNGLGERLKAVARLWPYLKHEQPNAVITFQHYGNIFGGAIARLLGCRYVIANQSGAPGLVENSQIAALVDRVIGSIGVYHYNVVNSLWTERQFAHYPSAYRHRTRLIPHGIPAPSAQYDKAVARARFGITSVGPLVVTTGRLAPQKNHLCLVKMLELLPNVSVAIAGIGPLESTLASAASDAGVFDRLFLVGEVLPGDVYEFLAAGDIFVFPSTWETFGLSVVEAAVAGLPVVCSDLKVLREVLAPPGYKPAAIFVDQTRPEALASAVSSVLTDQSQSDALSQAGGSLRQLYSVGEMTDKYLGLLV